LHGRPLRGREKRQNGAWSDFWITELRKPKKGKKDSGKKLGGKKEGNLESDWRRCGVTHGDRGRKKGCNPSFGNG